jgi:hypothetical protein
VIEEAENARMSLSFGLVGKKMPSEVPKVEAQFSLRTIDGR